VTRAEQVLDGIEEENVVEVRGGKRVHMQSLLLTPASESAIEAELRKLDLSKMTPMEAFVKLSEIKKKLRKSYGE
jgi:DNA mismatch repair ATPase MutS